MHTLTMSYYWYNTPFTQTLVCTHTHTHSHTVDINVLALLTLCFNIIIIGTSPSSWTDRLQSVTINSFTSTVGPTTDIPESPIDVFELFFSDDLQEEIVRETNRYAKQVMGDQ